MVRWSCVRYRELSIDPGNKIASRKITNEQKQRVGELIEVAVAEGERRQGACLYMLRFSTSAGPFLILAAIELPVGPQLRARGLCRQSTLYIAPPRSTVLFH